VSTTEQVKEKSMTATSEQQPTLDLGDYRGQRIVKTRVKLANANDGFDPSTSLEDPKVYEIGERLVIAVEVVVASHTPKASSLDPEAEITIDLLQTFKCGTMAVVPRSAVAKQLNAAAKADEARDKAAAAAKAAARPKRVAMTSGAKVIDIAEGLAAAGAKGEFQA
jgi:hypothetical protein